MNSTQEIIAAADGSALGNPGPAGWAWYIDDDHWASGGWAHGTNNMGELKAVLDLFEATASRPEAKLRVYCDSQYVINSLTKWMPGWKKKGWKKSDGKPVLNRDLLEALDQALTGRDYEFIWVKGHAGHALNEKADSLANGAARAYQEGREPAHGPGFGAAAEPTTAAEPVEAPAVEVPIVNAPAAEPALLDVVLPEVALSEPAPSESSADAHLPVQELTAAEIENAQRGVESLRLSGLLRPASAVNAPDPEAVRTRKEQLALAAERAAERDAKALARQQEETAQQASSAAQAEEEDDLTGLEEFAGLDPNDVDPAELLGETEAHAEEQAVEPAAAPAQTVEPAQVEAPVKDAPASAPAAPALNPEEAAAAEQLLESRGSVMEAPQLESMLHERLVWVTATGRSVSCADTIAYRARAFTQQGAPLKQGMQVLDSSSVLVMAAVATARGRVSRSSIWHYDAERGLWRLRFRQETPAS